MNVCLLCSDAVWLGAVGAPLGTDGFSQVSGQLGFLQGNHSLFLVGFVVYAAQFAISHVAVSLWKGAEKLV